MKFYKWLILLISLFPIALSAHGNNQFGNHHMMDAWNTSNSFWYIVIPIFLLVVLFLAIYIFKSNKIHSNAIEVLKVRYAKGEISKEEFEQMKRDIVS